MGQLATFLIDKGFFPALGTMELYRGEHKLVRRGAPLTQGRDQGIIALYDTRGWPWLIIARKLSMREWLELNDGIYVGSDLVHFQQGAYVPHSNDKGEFMRITLPDLLNN